MECFQLSGLQHQLPVALGRRLQRGSLNGIGPQEQQELIGRQPPPPAHNSTILTVPEAESRLRLQASESAIAQLTEFRREAYSEQMLRWQLDVLVAQRDKADPADIPEAAVLGINDYWGTYATLARAGHRDVRLLWHADSSSPQQIWFWLEPWIRRARSEARLGAPTFGDLEWLAVTLADMDRRAGRPPVTLEIATRERPRFIALHEDEIHYAVALRTDPAARG